MYEGQSQANKKAIAASIAAHRAKFADDADELRKLYVAAARSNSALVELIVQRSKRKQPERPVS